jgi:glycosidase
MRTNPHVLEVSAQIWLKKIQREIGRQITLADVPESYIFELKAAGFDALWLMGVWEESVSSRQIARSDSPINNYLKRIVPDYKKEDIFGSPYSICSYKVDERFGTREDLLKFKQKLNENGLSLILDFVGNHFSVDHPLTWQEPDLFITSKEEPQDKDLFYQNRKGVWLAHGKDPYFAPWTDSAQLNLFNPKTRQMLEKFLMEVCPLCDGLRCDMVMLMLNKVHKEIWGKYINYNTPSEEFWPNAIKAVKEKYPSFTFIAEVYWGLESEVQDLGFDFTYDKILYDRLLFSNPTQIADHLRAEHLYQKKTIRFIANHDEETPLTAFGSKERSFAAAAVAYTLSGARLFTSSQLYGDKHRLPIQYLPEIIPVNKEVKTFYKNFLNIINHPCFHGGQWALKAARSYDGKDNSYQNILTWSWTQNTTCKIVVINYSNQNSKFKISIDKLPKQNEIRLKDEFLETFINASYDELKNKGLELSLAPYEFKIFSVDF